MPLSSLYQDGCIMLGALEDVGEFFCMILACSSVIFISSTFDRFALGRR